jgi:hypothetical protein
MPLSCEGGVFQRKLRARFCARFDPFATFSRAEGLSDFVDSQCRMGPDATQAWPDLDVAVLAWSGEPGRVAGVCVLSYEHVIGRSGQVD